MYKFKANLMEGKTGKGLWVMRNYQDNDSDKPVKSTSVHKGMKNSFKDHNRTKETKRKLGSERRDELDAPRKELERRQAERESNFFANLLFPFKPKLEEAYHTRDAKIKKRFWNVLELSESAIHDVVKDLKMYRKEHHDSFNELANSRKKDQDTKDQMDHHIYHINKIDSILDDLQQYIKHKV